MNGCAAMNNGLEIEFTKPPTRAAAGIGVPTLSKGPAP
jgi:hypothetical protein